MPREKNRKKEREHIQLNHLFRECKSAIVGALVLLRHQRQCSAFRPADLIPYIYVNLATTAFAALMLKGGEGVLYFTIYIQFRLDSPVQERHLHTRLERWGTGFARNTIIFHPSSRIYIYAGTWMCRHTRVLYYGT